MWRGNLGNTTGAHCHYGSDRPAEKQAGGGEHAVKAHPSCITVWLLYDCGKPLGGTADQQRTRPGGGRLSCRAGGMQLGQASNSYPWCV